MRHLILFFSFLIAAACQPNLDMEPAFVEKGILEDLLEGDFFTPVDSVGYVFRHSLGNRKYESFRQRFYDKGGKLAFELGISNGDTVGVRNIEYEEGIRIGEQYFEIVDKELRLSWERKYIRGENGQNETAFSRTKGNDFSFLYRDYYNEEGMLWRRAFTQDENSYRLEYLYDKDNRIIKEILLDSSDTPVTYYYRYNEKGQLEAKEIEDIAGQGDAFQYFYDEAGRLMEEKEFVPSYGFPLSVIVEYKYYSN